MSEVIAPKRRRLADLYMVGKELTFNDDSDNDPITVWLSKISPIEQKDAADQATKARARLLTLKNSPIEDLIAYEDQMESLELIEKEEMVKFILSSKIEQAKISNEQRIGFEDSWSKDDYLNSLQTAWNDSLRDAWLANPDDEEARRVYDELKRFTDEVQEASKEEIEGIIAEYDHVSYEDAKRDTINKLIEAEADFAWMNEFSYYQVFYSVREIDDHKVRYFESVDEVKCVDNRIIVEIISAYRDMTVEGVEGKD